MNASNSRSSLHLDIPSDVTPEDALLPLRTVWTADKIVNKASHGLNPVYDRLPIYIQRPSIRLCLRQQIILKIMTLANNDISCEGC
jgi:hypothetical protein